MGPLHPKVHIFTNNKSLILIITYHRYARAQHAYTKVERDRLRNARDHKTRRLHTPIIVILYNFKLKIHVSFTVIFQQIKNPLINFWYLLYINLKNEKG